MIFQKDADRVDLGMPKCSSEHVFSMVVDPEEVLHSVPYLQALKVDLGLAIVRTALFQHRWLNLQ
jgi:hypothetical protein